MILGNNHKPDIDFNGMFAIVAKLVYVWVFTLYGLCQAPRNWFSKLAVALHKFSFVQSRADYSIFS